MPQLGETVAEGKIVKWFKAAGDAVKPGDNLFEIETDKTSMEVPATSAGTLSEIRFQVGEVAKVGAVVAVIAGGGRRRQALPRQRSRPAKAGARAKPPLGPRLAGTTAAFVPPPAPVQTVGADGPIPRSAHAGAQFRAGEDGKRRIHDATGAAAGRRARHRSLARFRLRPAWPHRRRRCRQGGACRRARDGHGRQRRAGQGALRGYRL